MLKGMFDGYRSEVLIKLRKSLYRAGCHLVGVEAMSSYGYVVLPKLLGHP